MDITVGHQQKDPQKCDRLHDPFTIGRVYVIFTAAKEYPGEQAAVNLSFSFRTPSVTTFLISAWNKFENS